MNSSKITQQYCSAVGKNVIVEDRPGKIRTCMYQSECAKHGGCTNKLMAAGKDAPTS